MGFNYLTGYEVIVPWGLGDSAFDYEGVQNGTTKVIPAISAKNLGWNRMNRYSRSSKLSCIAIGEALKKSKSMTVFNEDLLDNENTGIILGTSYSNLEAIEKLESEAIHFGVNNVNPGIFPNTVLNVVAGNASIYFNIKCANITLSNGDLTGPKCLLYALDMLNRNILEKIVVCQCNVFPPDKYREECEHSSRFESVIAYVIEKKEEHIPELPQLCVSYNSQGLKPTDLTRPENFMLDNLLNIRKLEKYKMYSSEITCDLGKEGTLTMTITRGKDRHD